MEQISTLLETYPATWLLVALGMAFGIVRGALNMADDCARRRARSRE